MRLSSQLPPRPHTHTRAQSLPYAELQAALDVPTLAALERLLVSCIYAGLVQGKLDQRTSSLEVSSAVGRDITPEQLPALAERLRQWQASVQDAIAALEQQARATVDARVKDEQARLQRHKAVENAAGQAMHSERTSASSSSGGGGMSSAARRAGMMGTGAGAGPGPMAAMMGDSRYGPMMSGRQEEGYLLLSSMGGGGGALPPAHRHHHHHAGGAGAGAGGGSLGGTDDEGYGSAGDSAEGHGVGGAGVGAGAGAGGGGGGGGGGGVGPQPKRERRAGANGGNGGTGAGGGRDAGGGGMPGGARG
jgi:hypothetical protein